MRTLAEIEDAMIDYAIQAARSKARAADLLGIGRSTLYRHLLKDEACNRDRHAGPFGSQDRKIN
jgi:DNA-binding protein Fis